MAEVMRAASPYDGQSYFQTPILHSSSPPTFARDSSPYSTSSRSSLHDSKSQITLSESSSEPDSPPIYPSDISRSPSMHSTIPSTVSLDRRKSIDEEIDLPCYDTAHYGHVPEDSREYVDSPYPEPATAEDSVGTADDLTTSSTGSPGPRPVADDSAIRDEPSLQVDYLSHDWREEDIWFSWRHIVSKRRTYGETSRLENASWRTWTKSKYQLKTVSPETLNWLKDCDVTWLYGPLQQAPATRSTSEPTSRLSKTNSFLSKKPILKKRNLSEVMLQKSLSASSLVKQAAASVQAQRSQGDVDVRRRVAPVVGRIPSDVPTPLNSAAPTVDGTESASYLPSETSSGLQSPDHNRKHISFNEKVEQCIAVDFKQPEPEEEEEELQWMSSIDESSEDELVMRSSARRHASGSSSRRNSVTQEGKTIQILAPTTLKSHQDDTDEIRSPGSLSLARSPGRLSQSSSQETLRPSRPTTNFFIDDNDVNGEMSWDPSDANSNHWTTDNDDSFKGMRRTPSGMFMPFNDDEDDDLPRNGILGRFVDTVNTAKDIAHVIWNVGWRQ